MIAGMTPYNIPVDMAEMRAVEMLYGGQLPQAYKEFLFRCNGGICRLSEKDEFVHFRFIHPVDKGEDDARLMELYPVVCRGETYRRTTVRSATDNLIKEGLRPGIVVFAGDDGSGCLCLDSGRNGAVVYFLQDYGFDGEGVCVARDFASFVTDCRFGL